MNHKRIFKRQGKELGNGPVIYWMQRDQRSSDNWALIHAAALASENKVPLIVTFNLVPGFLGATIRHYGFMLAGLRETEKKLHEKNIPFHLLTGDPADTLPRFVKDTGASYLVSDFNPLRIARLWKKQVIDSVDIPFHTVDAHNIVPAWVVSDKQEFAARTIRPKIHKKLPEFLDEFPTLPGFEKNEFKTDGVNWDKVKEGLDVDRNVTEAGLFQPGEDAALKQLRKFIKDNLKRYPEESNDPNAGADSGLSPYLHFGHISAQRVALEVKDSGAPKEAKEAFLEQLIVRKELTDNFCLYNPDYDKYEGFPDWAKATLEKHLKDEREEIYTLEEFEKAETDDRLWNAAQKEMVNTGKMHNYMRMYWAKKILEWTENPHDALKYTIYLNDKYELDGRDPNGYVGAAWSVGGVHDRPWQEREVFGKIRYMNFNGAKRKFDVEKYIETN